jgi:hypothetical protein
MLQVLPGISVVPHQCDDAEQHPRRAKDSPPIQRRLHTEKATPSLLRACGTSAVISALSLCSVSEKRGIHEFAYLSMGDLRTKPGSTHRHCQCPIWVDRFLGGKEMRESLKLRDWQLLLLPASIISGIFT